MIINPDIRKPAVEAMFSVWKHKTDYPEYVSTKVIDMTYKLYIRPQLDYGGESIVNKEQI